MGTSINYGWGKTEIVEWISAVPLRFGRFQFQDFGMASVHVNSQLFAILELSCDLIRDKVFPFSFD